MHNGKFSDDERQQTMRRIILAISISIFVVPAVAAEKYHIHLAQGQETTSYLISKEKISDQPIRYETVVRAVTREPYSKPSKKPDAAILKYAVTCGPRAGVMVTESPFGGANDPIIINARRGPDNRSEEMKYFLFYKVCNVAPPKKLYSHHD
jgi:hypothetical protein